MHRVLAGLAILATAIQSSATNAQSVWCDASDCDAYCDCSTGGRDAPDGWYQHTERVCDRWDEIRRSLEDGGIKFEGGISQFYQGVSSGGLQQKFRDGGHGDYEAGFDFGRMCGLDGFTIELGAEHRFAETVNLATGSVIPVAVAPSSPSPTTNDLALTKVRFAYKVYDNVEVFLGKIDALEETTNAFADGNGTERFFATPFNFYAISVRTIPFSTLAAGFNVIRDEERMFTLAVLNTKDTATTVGISDLFANGAAIFSELRLPLTIRGRRGHQAIGGSWSSATFTSLAQEGRILFPDIPIAKKEGSWSLFWSGDQYLWQDPCDDKRGWGLFGEAGISDGNPNPIQWSLTFGVGGNSPLLGREVDRFGIGWYYVGISVEFGLCQLTDPIGDGQGIELFYDIAMSERFRLAFDLQFVDPTLARADTAVVPGMRGRIDF